MARAPSPTPRNAAVEAVLGRLYEVPPAGFVALRKALAAELRAQGDKAGASEIAEARRPTATAWAVNQVALRHPAVMRAFQSAIEALRGAQARASGGGLSPRFAAARATLKDRTRDVVQAAREAMTAEKIPWTPEAQRRVAQTLHSMPFASPADLARLLSGRLDKDLEVESDFEALAMSHAPEAEISLPRHEPSAVKTDTKEERRRALEATRKAAEEKRDADRRARLEAARLAEERARTEAREAEARAAEKEAARLEAKAARAEEAATRARGEADAAAEAARKAREVVRGRR